MASFTKWIKSAVQSILDPDREQRIHQIVVRLHEGLRRERQSFSLAASMQGLEHSLADLDEARSRVFQSILERGWSDNRLTPKERETMHWVASVLGLDPQKAKELNLSFAMKTFASKFARAMEDGHLSAGEEAELRELAESVDSTLPNFTQQFFQDEGEAFLRGMFLAFIEDGNLTKQEWDGILDTAKKIGVSQGQLASSIRPQALAFVEHVLADAKADERLSDFEEQSLDWLLLELRLPGEFQRYVRGEVKLLKQLTAISDGRLPSLQPPEGLGVRAGEIVHLTVPATWRQVRQLKHGPRVSDHVGYLVLTDCRILFTSPSKSHTLNLRRIVACDGAHRHISVQSSGKPMWTYYLTRDSILPWAIFRTAIAMANQTITAKVEGGNSRHIPRDVRQRVWQKYGGRCADCGATDYLEFDHVIPVAKGGSNSDNNIQLLCRRCNLSKSDHI